MGIPRVNHASGIRGFSPLRAVVTRPFWRMRSYSVSLSNKILGLLLGAVVLSTSLAGWIIYDGLRARAWKDAGEALLCAGHGPAWSTAEARRWWQMMA